ncbi:hypothetical protein PoB_005110100 [Plakobranchus ocellatus]|uniref:Uncharacterized protein n=1 Tax=Plakobranchus ocellatus TaxID=259542 RepID=A0AAV4BMT2_9GAST|nr:hypothetical protein PoB_005110100 [Plakobranchus ocellatus]
MGQFVIAFSTPSLSLGLKRTSCSFNARWTQRSNEKLTGSGLEFEPWTSHLVANCLTREATALHLKARWDVLSELLSTAQGPAKFARGKGEIEEKCEEGAATQPPNYLYYPAMHPPSTRISTDYHACCPRRPFAEDSRLLCSPEPETGTDTILCLT